ncbi:MAG: hypothetical protein GY760_18565 [Deltaproteobacteria bacterium]|nr:hypothetical protein [Deltaproteobacteria bacterium]
MLNFLKATFFRKRPSIVGIAIFIAPAFAGVLGCISGIYLIFIRDEFGLGIGLSILMGLTAILFGSYVLSSIGPYRKPNEYYLKLEPNKLIFSKGKETVLIPKETLTNVTYDIQGTNFPTKWTTIEYKENNQTKLERFADDEYGGQNFANMIRLKYMS